MQWDMLWFPSTVVVRGVTYRMVGVTVPMRQSNPHLPPRDDMPFTNSFSSMSPELSVSYVCKGGDGDEFQLAECHPSQQASIVFAAAQPVTAQRGTIMRAQTQCRMRPPSPLPIRGDRWRPSRAELPTLKIVSMTVLSDILNMVERWACSSNSRLLCTHMGRQKE